MRLLRTVDKASRQQPLEGRGERILPTLYAPYVCTL